MALDSLKSGVSDYKDRKTELLKQKDDWTAEVDKVDDLVSCASSLDDNVQTALKEVRDSFQIEGDILAEASDQLEREKLDLLKLINCEQEKLSTVQKKIDGLSGKKYTGGLDSVSQHCDALLAELDEMLADLDVNDGIGAAMDAPKRSSNIVKIDGCSYRVDDHGNIHMKRGDDKEYHVLPNTRYVVNGYTYQSDENGRIVHAEGNLTVKNGERASLNAKVSGMGANDQRGHIIADIFGGSNQNDNLVAQLQPINQGAYKVLESNLVDLVSSNHQVYGDYAIDYQGDTDRPSAITVSYSVDGGQPISQIDTFTKLGLLDVDGFSEFEKNCLALHQQGHSVNCNYRVVFSNDHNRCWLFVEHTVDDGFPVLTQFS